MKKTLCLFLVLAMLISMSACSGAPLEKSSDDDAIRIGVVCPRTGETSLWGDVLYQTVQLLADEQNEAGGLLGKKIDIKVYDNRDDAVETTNAARKAILKDKVAAFIGTDSSATTIALVEVASQNNIPVISSIATNSKVTMTDDGQVRPWAFRACMSDPQSGSILGQYAVKECGFKKIAIVYEIGSDFSIGVAEEFTRNVESTGGKIVISEAYNTGDVDYRAVLTKIKNHGDFDALYIAAGYYKQIGLIANQARELGISQPFLSTEGCMSNDIFNIAGDSLNGIIFNVAVDTESNKVDSLIERFTKRWDYDPSINVGPDCYLAYDAFKLLCGAIERAGIVDSQKIRDELENTKELDGLTCKISFDPKTHLVYREVPICQIKDGDFVTLSMYKPEMPE